MVGMRSSSSGSIGISALSSSFHSASASNHTTGRIVSDDRVQHQDDKESVNQNNYDEDIVRVEDFICKLMISCGVKNIIPWSNIKTSQQ
jgi:hypothetical protein